MSNLYNPDVYGPVEGLSPMPIPAELIARPTHLDCGGCGFHGVVEFYVYNDDGDNAFAPLCNCPLPATLSA